MGGPYNARMSHEPTRETVADIRGAEALLNSIRAAGYVAKMGRQGDGWGVAMMADGVIVASRGGTAMAALAATLAEANVDVEA